MNAAAHCFTCHQQLGENPVLFTEWIKGHLGPKKHADLMVRANRILKRSKKDKEELYQQMKAELARLEKLRNAGESGRLEFYLDYEVAA
jgi:hypothetical protein